MSESTLNAESIFFEAIQMPIESRETYIANACAGNQEMLAELRALLSSHSLNQNDDFILGRPENLQEPTDVATIAESEGDTIGRYRLLELIGEGGMGRVYMAEQIEGVRRRVALKIIKLGMDTRQIIARFEAERQAMALFDHPCITRVLDIGATSTGRPYFVMELVRGCSITNYVSENQLSLRERLQLFIEVCRAVQHAHQKGVIHRDLKPSNILVTQFDGVPVPKVIDFGIAKAIGQQRLTDKTLFTRYASMVGTPQYMSPEQAEMTGLDIDTRTDIYSLGVILYELITGSTPLDAAKLRPLNLLALYETLRDANIETPSSLLVRLNKSGETTKQKTSLRAPVTIPPERLKGDLDWVVMKSLSRDRNLRYESASDLATDIDRFISGDPVDAAPPSRFYLLKTVLRKYRRAATAVIAFATLLLFAVVACSWLALSNFQTSLRLADTNEQLETSNNKLKQTVEQLKIAETSIRRAVEEDKYAAAISMAMIQFDMKFGRELEKELSRLHSLQTPSEVFHDQAIFSGVETTVGFESTVFTEGALDHAELLEFDHSDLLATAITPIRMFLKDQEKQSEQLFEVTQDNMFPNEAVAVPGTAFTVDAESLVAGKPIRVDIQQIIQRIRPSFYRFLLKEYRRVFGESDPRTGEALNLLAVHLLETEKFDEAESRLRESISISKDEVKVAARSLLKIVKARIRQPRNVPKFDSENR